MMNLDNMRNGTHREWNLRMLRTERAAEDEIVMPELLLPEETTRTRVGACRTYTNSASGACDELLSEVLAKRAPLGGIGSA